jgi:hypothetical protein
VITVEPFGSVGAAIKRAAATYAQRYSPILDSEVEVIWAS